MTIRTSKTALKFSRRALLKSLGLGAGFLPLLSTERARGATSAGYPRRLITIAVTDGICPPDFYTASGGSLPATLPFTLQPLATWSSKLLLLRQANKQGERHRLQRHDGHRRQVRRPLHLPRPADRRRHVAQRNRFGARP